MFFLNLMVDSIKSYHVLDFDKQDLPRWSSKEFEPRLQGLLFEAEMAAILVPKVFRMRDFYGF